MTDTITVRQFGKKHVHIHNDLLNAAHFFHSRIEERVAAKDEKGLAFDHMSCLILVAFSFEAIINFFGDACIQGWKERAPFDNKTDEVLEILKIKRLKGERPFSSIDMIKEFRDLVAHGKPKVFPFDEVVDIPASEADRPTDLSGKWEAFCTLENVRMAYDDIDKIIKMMHEASPFSLYDSLTRNESTVTLVKG